jgi:putative tryptophan/tyrosine transport system substrate-binding protein
MLDLGRRQVIAAALPLAARAQQGGRMRLIGVLAQGAANDPETAAYLTAFVQGLQELGWGVGRNARIEYRWAGGDVTLIRQYAAELLALAPDVILAAGGLGMRPLLDLTSSVPIVFDALDPVAAGFVDSLARPGGNATGFSQFDLAMSGKWLELLKEIAPNVKRVAVLRDPNNIAGIGQLTQSRRWRRRSASSCFRSTFETPPQSSVASAQLRERRTAA